MRTSVDRRTGIVTGGEELTPQQAAALDRSHVRLSGDPPRWRPRGLGDLVARVTSALGVRPCSPCDQRRERLNELWPLGGSKPDPGAGRVPP